MTEKKSGLECPACRDTSSRVYWSEPRPGFRVRGRECTLCGHRYATRETLTGGRRVNNPTDTGPQTGYRRP